MPQFAFQLFSSITGDRATFLYNTFTFLIANRILDFGKSSGRYLCKLVKCKLNISHIVPKIFFMQPLIFFILFYSFSRPCLG